MKGGTSPVISKLDKNFVDIFSRHWLASDFVCGFPADVRRFTARHEIFRSHRASQWTISHVSFSNAPAVCLFQDQMWVLSAGTKVTPA